MATPRDSLGSITYISVPQLGIFPSQWRYPLLHPLSVSTNFNGSQTTVETPSIGGSSYSILRHSNNMVLPFMYEPLPKKQKNLDIKNNNNNNKKLIIFPLYVCNLGAHDGLFDGHFNALLIFFLILFPMVIFVFYLIFFVMLFITVDVHLDALRHILYVVHLDFLWSFWWSSS